MPPTRGAYRNSVYSSYERTIDIENTDTTSLRAGLKRSRSREKYDVTTSLDFYYDKLLPEGQPAQISKALVPAFAWTRRDVDNPVFPRRGNVINTQIGVAARGFLSDATFLRLYGRIRQYIPVGKRDLVVARLELGADLTGDSSSQIPATLRFRAGAPDSEEQDRSGDQSTHDSSRWSRSRERSAPAARAHLSGLTGVWALTLGAAEVRARRARTTSARPGGR